MGRKKKWKSPVRRRRGPENPCTLYSAHAKPLVHPLKVDSRMREVHTIVAVRLKPRMTILPKRKRTARSRAVLSVNSISWRNRFRDRVARTWPSPPRGDHQLITTRPNGFCLCAISQLGSCMSCRNWNYGDSAFNLRFDANTLSGIAVTAHFHS